MKIDYLLHAVVIVCVLVAGVYIYGNMQEADARAFIEMQRGK